MAKAKTEGAELHIDAPKFQTIDVRITGTAPYVQHAFPEKARKEIRAKQESGKQATGKKKREPKNFDECYEQAIHRMQDGSYGIPAPAFRNAMIDACRLTDAAMTQTKLLIFVEADGFDAVDGTPLVAIMKGEPRKVEHAVRLATGVSDLRVRPMWDPGWEATVRVRYDADFMSAESVVNLLERVGQQVGIGEGRPFSKKSAGMGWGLFTTVSVSKAKEDAA